LRRRRDQWKAVNLLFPVFFAVLLTTIGLMVASLAYLQQTGRQPQAAEIREAEETSLTDGQGYLGVYQDRIAIYRGNPPDGRLERVTEFEVKEDIRDQLEQGVPFTGPEELFRLLESYTS